MKCQKWGDATKFTLQVDIKRSVKTIGCVVNEIKEAYAKNVSASTIKCILNKTGLHGTTTASKVTTETDTKSPYKICAGKYG